MVLQKQLRKGIVIMISVLLFHHLITQMCRLTNIGLFHYRPSSCRSIDHQWNQATNSKAVHLALRSKVYCFLAFWFGSLVFSNVQLFISYGIPCVNAPEIPSISSFQVLM